MGALWPEPWPGSAACTRTPTPAPPGWPPRTGHSWIHSQWCKLRNIVHLLLVRQWNDALTFLMILEVIHVDVYFCILPTNCKHRQSFSFMENISISLLLPSLDGVEWSPWVHGIKFRPRAIRIMHCILHWNCEHFQVISNTCLLVILLLIHYLQTQLMFVQNTA